MGGIRFKTIYLPVNQGHGNARRTSLEACSNELVALMDADDIAYPDRFEKQINRFSQDESLDIVGGQITEFIGSTSNTVDRRVVPEEDADIRVYAKKRCPMNQMTVMFRKSAYDRAGGYIDWYCEEDYYLWLRMMQEGCRFANVPDDIVHVRVGSEMSARRGGAKYFSSEVSLQKYMLRRGIISVPRFLYNVLIRFGGEIVLPASLRTKAFKFFRSSAGKAATHELGTTDIAAVGNRAGAMAGVMACETTDNTVEGVAGGADAATRSELPEFSVAMCVYAKDDPEWFDVSLGSVVDQTVRPDEIVLVVDGPVPDAIRDVIGKYEQICAGGERPPIFSKAVRH